MKALWLVIVFLTGCANAKEFLKTDEQQDAMAALFVANPTPNWTGRSFKDKCYPCNAVFVADRLAVTSIACFPPEKEGTRVYDLNTIVLENKERRFTVENVFFAEEASLVFLRTEEKGKPIYFDQKEVSYGEHLRLTGLAISGFRRFSQMEDMVIATATRFGNEQAGEFFIVRLEIADKVNGTALFRQIGDFVGIIVGSENGRALVVPVDVLQREIQKIDL